MSEAARGEQIVVWGAGGHARVVADALRAGGEWTLAGFLDDVDAGRRGSEFCGSLVLGGREQLTDLRHAGVEWAIVAIGDCAARLARSRLLADAGFRLAVVVHPRAVLSPAAWVGGGTLLAAGAVVGPASRLGQAVIVNTLASVDHDCVVEDGAQIGPGARLTGGVQVCEGALVGAGAVIIPGVTIGAGSVVGAGAVVLEDVAPGAVVCGNPARVLQTKASI
ncbi:MAG TPA: acetyltransferase [Planctomycetaceae bacterium]|nr:acetyltransferase [Planctomycetaceae bacterium]